MKTIITQNIILISIMLSFQKIYILLQLTYIYKFQNQLIFHSRFYHPIQKHVDLSISNTTNFPKTATVESIKDMYVRGWKRKTKGLTVYVDGSLEGVLNEVEECDT